MRSLSTKDGVSSPSDDKGSDRKGTGAYPRTAGSGRGPVVGSSPGRRTGSLSKTRMAQGAVTPSAHLGVPLSLSVTPGPRGRMRQQLGWEKVCGTARSGIWVQKGDARSYTLPSTLDHLGVVWRSARKGRPGSHQGTPVCARTNTGVEQQSDHDHVTPFGMES